MCGIAELAAVWLELEKLSCPFHALWLCWLSLILGRTLYKVCVLLLSLMKHLYHVLSKHGLIRGTEFMSV
jgi:hypothetical protein